MAAVHSVLPIFVVGASRSGTTLLARILGRHPDIAFVRETQYFDDLWPVRHLREPVSRSAAPRIVRKTLQRASVERLDEYVLAEAVRQILAVSATPTAAALYRETLGWLAARAGKRFFVEHTPRNVYYLVPLSQLYPDACFVCIVRDPRAVVASQKMRWRQRRLGAHAISRLETLRLRANYHPYTACRLWNRAARCIIDHGKANHVTTVRYEDLVGSPEVTVTRVLAEAELPYRSEMLDVPLWGSSHELHVAGSGIHASLATRWKGVLSSTEKLIVEDRCETLMREFEYEPTENRKEAIPYLRPSLLFPLHCLAVAAVNPRRALIQLRSLTSSK